MRVSTKSVTKVIIEDIDNLDNVNVALEEYGPGRGKVTIDCFGDAWSHYWGAMGEKNLIDFIISCDCYYLAKKFAPHVQSEILITDEKQLEKEMKKEVVSRRLELGFEKDEARKVWEEIESSHCSVENTDLMHSVFGDDWWEYAPSEPNPEYEYILRVVQATKDGLKMYKEERG